MKQDARGKETLGKEEGTTSAEDREEIESGGDAEADGGDAEAGGNFGGVRGWGQGGGLLAREREPSPFQAGFGLWVGEDGFDLGFEFGGVLVAEVGGFFQGAEDDLVEADVDLDFGGGWGEGVGGEFAGEHLVEDDAEGVDVGAVVDGVGGGALFGGHVLGGAHDRGAVVVFRGPWSVIRGGNDASEAEVGDFDLAGLSEEDVFGFDVAVDDAAVVGVLEGVADLGDDGEGVVGGEVRGVEELRSWRRERPSMNSMRKKKIVRGLGSGDWGMREGAPVF